MCNYALVFFIKATVSAPCEPCMSCRFVYVIASVILMYFHLTNKMDGWMESTDVLYRMWIR